MLQDRLPIDQALYLIGKSVEGLDKSLSVVLASHTMGERERREEFTVTASKKKKVKEKVK